MSEEIYYDQNDYNGSEINENPNSGKTGFAVASLVLGIISVLCCCFGLGYITAPLSLIFGIIALVKRHGGTVMSIIGVVLSSNFKEQAREAINPYEKSGTLDIMFNIIKEFPLNDLIKKTFYNI